MTTSSRRDILTSLPGAAALGVLGLSGACSDEPDSSMARPTTSIPPRPDHSDGASLRGTTRIVVLGSHGGQQITQLTGANTRVGSSILVDVDDELTLLDCGAGSTHRLAEAGYDANQLRNILVTHFHADHVAELGGLASFAWSSGRNGDHRERRLDIYGPTGTHDYEAGIKQALRLSIADQEGPLAQTPPFDGFAYWHEFEPPQQPLEIFANQHLDVRAVAVKHGEIPAVAYRVRTAEVDVVFSGDRGVRGDDFVSFAAGADVLFHEVIHRSLVETALREQDAAESFIDHLVNDHTDAADVGRIAAETGASTLVLYHLIPGNPAIGDEVWVDLVRPHFSGDIVVARDLMQI